MVSHVPSPSARHASLDGLAPVAVAVLSLVAVGVAGGCGSRRRWPGRSPGGLSGCGGVPWFVRWPWSGFRVRVGLLWSFGPSWPGWWGLCWRPVVRWRSGARRARMRSFARPLPPLWCFPRRRSAPVAARSPPGRWRWYGRSRRAVRVPGWWCFPARRVRRVWCRPLGRRPAFVVSVPGRGRPPRSPPGWVCRSSCSRAGSRPSRPGALGGPPPLLGFGRVGGCWVSCRWVLRHSWRIFLQGNYSFCLICYSKRYIIDLAVKH